MVFPKRSLYHSNLREKTEASPLRVCFTSPPRDSKYPNKPAYVTLEIEGDGIDYTYAVENEAIRAQLTKVDFGPWYEVRALGAKDSAFLEITEADSAKSDEPAGAQRQDAAEGPSLSRGYWEALDAAVLLVEAFRKRHGREPSEAERAIACTLWIEQNRSHGRRPLCSKEG